MKEFDTQTNSEIRHLLITMRLELFSAAQILQGQQLYELEQMVIDVANFISNKRKKQ